MDVEHCCGLRVYVDACICVRVCVHGPLREIGTVVCLIGEGLLSVVSMNDIRVECRVV